MDGLRMLDEWQSFADLVPSEDLVFRQSGGFDAYATRLEAASGPQRAEAERVFDLIDGRLAVRRIIDLSRLGTFDATRILAGLQSAGAIELLDAGGVQRPRAVTRRQRSPRARVRGWLGGLLPLSLLLCVAIASLNEIRPSAAEGFAIRREALATARAVYAQRRLRHALEDHRMTVGSYPRELADLRTLPGDALASPAGAPYYYAPREDGAMLLAPER